MRNHLIPLAVAATVILGPGLGSGLANDPPGEPVRVTNYGEKAPVMFDHARHAEVECANCHHNQEDGRYKCGKCHGEAASGDTPKLKDAMHKKDGGACYACHFGSEPQAKKLKCAECHVKR